MSEQDVIDAINRTIFISDVIKQGRYNDAVRLFNLFNADIGIGRVKVKLYVVCRSLSLNELKEAHMNVREYLEKLNQNTTRKNTYKGFKDLEYWIRLMFNARLGRLRRLGKTDDDLYFDDEDIRNYYWDEYHSLNDFDYDEEEDDNDY